MTVHRIYLEKTRSKKSAQDISQPTLLVDKRHCFSNLSDSTIQTEEPFEPFNNQCWEIKKTLGCGFCEHSKFAQMSVRRLDCRLHNRLESNKESSLAQLGFHIILRGESHYNFYDRGEKPKVGWPQVWVQNGKLGSFKISAPANQNLQKISIFLDADYLDYLYKHHPNNQLLHSLTKKNETLFKRLHHVSSRVFEQASQLIQLSYPASKLEKMTLQGQCLTLVTLLLTESLESIDDTSDKISPAKVAAQRAKIYIDENISTNKTIADLASSVGTNSCYLKHEFKQLTGLTILEYRRQKQMQLALTYVSENRLTLDIIAEQLGFNSTDYFIKVFKTYYKQHPKKFYRAKHKI